MSLIHGISTIAIVNLLREEVHIQHIQLCISTVKSPNGGDVELGPRYY